MGVRVSACEDGCVWRSWATNHCVLQLLYKIPIFGHPGGESVPSCDVTDRTLHVMKMMSASLWLRYLGWNIWDENKVGEPRSGAGGRYCALNVYICID